MYQKSPNLVCEVLQNSSKNLHYSHINKLESIYNGSVTVVVGIVS